MRPTHCIPFQLKDPKFKFYLIGTNSKIPMQKAWNSTNNYSYDDPNLLQHHGNYGVCTGYGQLIVLDLDDKEFSEGDVFTRILPQTFTVCSAGRKLPHMYYILNGEMFKKVNVRSTEGEVLMDIQADRAGVVGPGSTIDRKFYTIMKDLPIAEVDIEDLQREFYLKFKKKSTKWDNVQFKRNLEQASETVQKLHQLGFKQTQNASFQCPFHEMNGLGNLAIMESTGALYCFHEQKYWGDLTIFLQECKNRGVMP